MQETMTPTTEERLLTVADVQAFTKFSRPVVMAFIHRTDDLRLPAVKVNGGHYRITLSAYNRWARRIAEADTEDGNGG